MKAAHLVFPHQLLEVNPLIELSGQYYLIEEQLFFRQYAFHKQKIAFHRATMKFYEQYLMDKGLSVKYIESNQPASDVRELIQELYAQGFKLLRIVDPADDWLFSRIKSKCKKLKLELQVLDTPMFLNSYDDVNIYFNSLKKRYSQAEFYKQERIKRSILINDEGQPIGGQWSFDSDNRKKFPKGKRPALTQFPSANAYFEEAVNYTNQYFSKNPGELEATLSYPIGFEAGANWLEVFLQQRLSEFGDYEDAILANEMLLNHSLLTPMLNVGLITPQQIINRTIAYHQANEVPLNSLEGFIRQVIGWREFIRGVYVAKGREERTCNYWGFKRKIPRSFYDGTTGILPVDVTIRKVLKTGYCHHIERLMVLGNFMLLCEFDPDEVYQWFMELFIDAYDWVMVPNVYGMSQFADGGIMATKPYISGSNYLMKMSDFPKGEWQEIWDALFWRFMDKQRYFFLKNPRMGMLVKTYDQWDDSKKQRFQKKADDYLRSLA